MILSIDLFISPCQFRIAENRADDILGTQHFCIRSNDYTVGTCCAAHGSSKPVTFKKEKRIVVTTFVTHLLPIVKPRFPSSRDGVCKCFERIHCFS